MSSNNDHCQALYGEKLLQVISDRLGDSIEHRDIRPLVKKDSPAFLLRYPFGHEIVCEGRFIPPCGDDGWCTCCNNLMETIDSRNTTIPLSLVMSGAVEAYLHLSDVTQKSNWPRAMSRPMRILGTGEYFGVFETLDSVLLNQADAPPWNVSSGARSIILLSSKLSTRGETWIKRLLEEMGDFSRSEITDILLRMKSDSWEVVRYLVSKTRELSANNHWQSEVLVLPGATSIQSISNASAINVLMKLLSIGWEQSRHFRTRLVGEEQLANNEYIKGTTIHREEHYILLGILRQVLAVANGELPAFTLENSDEYIPITEVRRQFKHSPDWNAPVILEPRHLKRAGDTGFISIKYNCIPALEGIEPRSFSKFSEHVIGALEKSGSDRLNLKPNMTGFIDPVEAWEVLGATKIVDVAPADVPQKHPFFTGCLMIVRGE